MFRTDHACRAFRRGFSWVAGAVVDATLEQQRPCIPAIRRSYAGVMKCKGMVEFHGHTYRIMKVNQRLYEVFRILDDVKVGTFDVAPRLEVHPNGVAREVLLEIAITALKQAKISWRDTAAAIDSSQR
jgi:hypothetical protein